MDKEKRPTVDKAFTEIQTYLNHVRNNPPQESEMAYLKWLQLALETVAQEVNVECERLSLYNASNKKDSSRELNI